MKKIFVFIFITLYSIQSTSQTISFYDFDTKDPVSFATISFGNGLGSFANASGEFHFPKDRYPDVDTLYVSAMGYKDLKLATEKILPIYLMEVDIDQLQEVVISIPKKGKFKRHTYTPISHNEYFHSWLPTVESEIAVLIERHNDKSSKISTLLFPINTEEKIEGKTIATRPFSTLIRVKFYENLNGLPSKEISYGTIVFIITHLDNQKVFELHVDDYAIFIPPSGLFVSLQVLGATDDTGKLLQTKKYNEIKTSRGIEKVSITYRPLLPFSNQFKNNKTFVRRVFFNNKKWQPFDYNYNPNSELLRKGYNNYGMGAKLHVYDN